MAGTSPNILWHPELGPHGPGTEVWIQHNWWIWAPSSPLGRPKTPPFTFPPTFPQARNDLALVHSLPTPQNASRRLEIATSCFWPKTRSGNFGSFWGVLRGEEATSPTLRTPLDATSARGEDRTPAAMGDSNASPQSATWGSVRFCELIRWHVGFHEYHKRLHWHHLQSLYF